MPSRIYGTKEGTAQFEASNQKRIELNRNYHVAQYMCKLTVNHTNVSANFKDEAILSLINSIQIVADGNEVLKNVPASKFHIGAIMSTGKKGLQTIHTADGAGTSEVYFPIYFSLPDFMLKPYDTILNTAVYSSLNMIINWANSQAVGNGITVNSAQLDVWSHSLTNFSRNEGETIKHFKETYLKTDITVTSSALTVQLPTNQFYKSFAIASTVDGKRVADVINHIIIKSGTTVIVSLDADEIKAKNYDDYSVQNADDLKGIYVIDFLDRDKLSDVLNTTDGKFNTLELVLDVTKQNGTNTLHVYSDIIDFTKTVEVQPKAVTSSPTA